MLEQVSKSKQTKTGRYTDKQFLGHEHDQTARCGRESRPRGALPAVQMRSSTLVRRLLTLSAYIHSKFMFLYRLPASKFAFNPISEGGSWKVEVDCLSAWDRQLGVNLRRVKSFFLLLLYFRGAQPAISIFSVCHAVFFVCLTVHFFIFLAFCWSASLLSKRLF